MFARLRPRSEGVCIFSHVGCFHVCPSSRRRCGGDRAACAVPAIRPDRLAHAVRGPGKALTANARPRESPSARSEWPRAGGSRPEPIPTRRSISSSTTPRRRQARRDDAAAQPDHRTWRQARRPRDGGARRRDAARYQQEAARLELLSDVAMAFVAVLAAQQRILLLDPPDRRLSNG